MARSQYKKPPESNRVAVDSIEIPTFEIKIFETSVSVPNHVQVW